MKQKKENKKSLFTLNRLTTSSIFTFKLAAGLFEKLKQNFLKFSLNKSLIFLSLPAIALGMAFLLPQTALAQTPTAVTYPSGGITAKVDVQVNGQNSNYVQSSGQGVSFTVLLTITGLTDVNGQSNHPQLNLGTDMLKGPSTNSGFVISSFGAGVDIAGTSANGNTCQTISSNYDTCNFSKGSGQVQVNGNSIVLNQQYPVVFNLSATALNSLKVTTPCAWNKSAANPQTGCFAIYPYFNLQACFNNSCSAVQPLALDNVGFAMYVGSAATAPTDVPAYGSTTGTANSTQAPSAVNGIISLLISVVQFIVGLLIAFVYWVFSLVIVPIISGVLGIHAYTDNFVAVIYPGWIVIRNLCDIFFVIALIIIAMATLFRIESYQYKHLLVQLIVAALLINFSLVIGQAVLGLADTVQSQFLPQNQKQVEALGGDLMAGARNATINYTQATTANAPNTGDLLAQVVQPMFWLALATGTFAVFCAIAVFLCIRIIALWILLMISPIAYACGVLPSTAGYRDEWWKNFLKYAFFTPIMAMFLNIAAVVALSSAAAPVFQQAAGLSLTNLSANVGSFVFSVGSYVLLLVFLVASLMVAEKFSIFGAEGITKLAKQGIYAPFAVAGKGFKAAGNRSLEFASDTTHVELDPRVWQHEIGEYLKKRKRDRQLAREERTLGGLPTGSPRDLLENYVNGRGMKRVWESRFGLRGFKHNMTKAKELEEKAKLLSDNDRARVQSEIAANNSNLSNLMNQRSALVAAGGDTKAIDVQISSLNVVIKTATDKLADDLRRRIDEKVGNTWSDEQRDKVKAEYKKFLALAEQVERPEAYYARAARLEREAEEDKKISKIHDEGELNKLLRNARRQGDKPKAVAIWKKLTRDRNLNEALEDEGLSTSFEDIIKFYEGWTDDEGVAHAGLAKDLGMNHHEMMQVATEVGYDAEESKQYNGARMTWIDPTTGQLNWNGYKGHHSDGGVQHTKHVLTEARKSEPRRRAGDLPRWTYGDEHYDENLGRRVFKLNRVGMDLLLDYASPGQERWAREQFNTWSAAAAESDPEFEQKLRARGKERGLDIPVEDPAKPGVKVNYVDKVIENIHMVGKGEYTSKK